MSLSGMSSSRLGGPGGPGGPGGVSPSGGPVSPRSTSSASSLKDAIQKDSSQINQILQETFQPKNESTGTTQASFMNVIEQLSSKNNLSSEIKDHFTQIKTKFDKVLSGFTNKNGEVAQDDMQALLEPLLNGIKDTFDSLADISDINNEIQVSFKKTA